MLSTSTVNLTKGILRHPRSVAFVVMAAVATIAMIPIFGHGLPPVSDVFVHYQWAWGFIEGLREGSLYPRWLANPNFGLGSPTMLYYPPLPFYVVAGFHLVTGSTLKAMALGCWLALSLSGIVMYVFARTTVSHPRAMLAGAIYILAPYHLIDLFHRAALSEFWAFVWVPLVLYAGCRVFSDRGWSSVPLLGVSYALLLLTHVITAFATTLILPLYALFITRDLRRIRKAVAGLLLGIGLSAIFLVPLILESGLVRLHRLHITKYRRYFLIENLPGAFRAAGNPESQDPNPFSQASDYPLYEASEIISILVFVLTSVLIWRWRRRGQPGDLQRGPVYAVWSIALFSLLMTTRLSEPIWRMIPGLPYMQFPFRWLLIASACLAFLTAAGWEMVIQQESFRRIFLGALVVLIALNLGTATIVVIRQQRGEQKIPQQLFDLDASEYRPRGWGYKDMQPSSATITVSEGEALTQGIDESGARQKYAISATTHATLKFHTLYFPGWVARINGERVETRASDEATIEVSVPPGDYLVTLSFEETAPRTIGKLTSAVSFLFVLAMLYLSRRSSRVAGAS